MTVMSRFLERAMKLPSAQTRDVHVERDLHDPAHPSSLTLPVSG